MAHRGQAHDLGWLCCRQFYEVTPFTVQLTPQAIVAAAQTLHADGDVQAEARL